jgi:HNH endonuclease
LYRHDLTAEYVRSILTYDPATGELTWRGTKSGRSNGNQVGSIVACHNGHRRVLTIDGKMYRAHRVIWLLMTGEWPKNDVDHEDRDSLNNRWKNLRDMTKADNNRNRAKKYKSYNRRPIVSSPTSDVT